MDLNHIPRSARIGIVGGGASGLSAAHYLGRAGFTEVTVLEQEDRVGGKCCSVPVGSHVYELGAVLGNRDYTTTLDLMAAVDLQGGPTEGFQCYDVDGRPIDLIPWRQIPRVVWQVLVHYAWAEQVRYRRIRQPGLAGVHPDLCQPFSQFAQRHGLALLPRAFSPPFTAFGYGYFDEVPAAYVLKYLDLHMVECIVAPTRRMEWPRGAETLWSRLAAKHDVHTGTTVRRVTRGDTVRVETDRGTWEFDALILTSPLDRSLGFLDATPTERRLFSQIRTYDYDVLLCRVDGLPEGSGLLPAHFLAKRFGHVLLWYQRTHGDPLCTIYVLGDGQMTQDQIERTCADDLRHLGARLEEVLAARRWRYFPHVTSEVMAGGFYDELERLQGTNRTYYAGEIMSFSTVELCAQYSRDLVARFFEGDRVGAGGSA
jgi:hypothetical protein